MIEATTTTAATRLNGKADAFLGSLEAVVQAFSVNRDAVVEIVDERIAQQAPRAVQCVTADGLVLGTVHGHVRPEFDKIAKRVAAGINVLLVGPAGCGKTHLAEQVAEALGLRFAFLACTAGVSESRLVGRFCPIGEGGRFVYVPAAFVDFYENGGLFLLDEVDAADPNVLLAINAAAANGHMETPNPDKPIIARHPDFRIIAAANTWGHGASREYVGRNQLDASTLDRFCVGKVALDYDADFEAKAGHPEVVAWVHGLRRAAREHQVRRVVSTRLVLDGSKLLAAGETLDDVKASFLLDWTDAEIARVGETRP